MLLTTEPILHHLDERHKFMIQVEVNDVAMAGVALQAEEDGYLHP